MLGRQRLIVRRTRLLGDAGRAVARLAALRVLDQPHRRARTRRGRAPPARRRRARDPRPQRPSPGALPIGQVHRQRRLDGDRRARAQPAALDDADRAARHHHPQPPARSADGCSRSPDASPAAPAASRCGCRPAGPGNTTSSPPSPACAHCPHRPDPAAARERRSSKTAGLGLPKAGRESRTHAGAMALNWPHPRTRRPPRSHTSYDAPKPTGSTADAAEPEQTVDRG